MNAKGTRFPFGLDYNVLLAFVNSPELRFWSHRFGTAHAIERVTEEILGRAGLFGMR